MIRHNAIQIFSIETFQSICDELCARDTDLAAIIHAFGYPPMWGRTNSFESLVHIILEQQVSLSSALAALNKLRERIGLVTPDRLLSLSDEELKACYFSRQKITYARLLAAAIIDNKLNLLALETMPDDEVVRAITALKGFGQWSADIYLMFVLRRADIFPAGDLAAVNALKEVKGINKTVHQQKLINDTTLWKPYRTVATMMLWHYYLSTRSKTYDAAAETVKHLTHLTEIS